MSYKITCPIHGYWDTVLDIVAINCNNKCPLCGSELIIEEI